MGTQPTFGHRGMPPGEMTPPVHIVKSFGRRLIPIMAMAVGVLAFQSLPQLLSGTSVTDILLHSVDGPIFLSIVAFVLIVWWIAKYPNSLDIDETAFYDWGDIERVDATQSAVKLRLVGRSTDQNSLNLIPGKFMGGPEALQAAIEAGQARWGAGRRPQGRSVAPG